MAFKPPGAARRARTGKTRTVPVEREPRGRVPHCRRLPDLQVYSSRKPWGRAWRTGYLARLIPLRCRVRFPEPQPENRRRCQGLRTPTTKHTHNQIISQPNTRTNTHLNKHTSIHTSIYTHTLYLLTSLRTPPLRTPCLAPPPSLPIHTHTAHTLPTHTRLASALHLPCLHTHARVPPLRPDPRRRQPILLAFHALRPRDDGTRTRVWGDGLPSSWCWPSAAMPLAPHMRPTAVQLKYSTSAGSNTCT